MRDRQDNVIPWLAVAACALVALIHWPFLPWILVAVWASAIAKPTHERLSRSLGHRRCIAALLTTSGLVLAIAPLVVLSVLLVDDGIAVLRRILAADRIQMLVATLADPQRNGSKDVIDLVVSQGERAWALSQQVAGTTAHIVIGLVIAIVGFYALLVDGERWYGWIQSQVPLSHASLHRLSGAVVETGRGMLFGVVGAGLVQTVVAIPLYIALGVPRPLTLGVLTFACSIIPAIGTALVWVPVSAALALTGQYTAAFVLFSMGLLVIGTLDNVVRPYLARRGRLQLPTVVVALSIFGGMAALGARGVILGPLAVRLSKELLAIWREQREAGPAA